MRRDKDLQRENRLFSRLKRNLTCICSWSILWDAQLPPVYWLAPEVERKESSTPEHHYFLSILPSVNISVSVSILSSAYALWQAGVWTLLPPWSGKLQLISLKSDLITHNWDCSHCLLLPLRIYHCADTNAERRKKTQKTMKMTGFSWGTAALTCTGLEKVPWS